MKASWKATFLGMPKLEFEFWVPTCAKTIHAKHFGSLGFPPIGVLDM